MSLFENDGCTLFPDGAFGLNWKTCCDVHDHAFATGHTWQDFISANYELWKCVATQGDIFVATIVLIGVLTGGALFFVFGRKKK